MVQKFLILQSVSLPRSNKFSFGEHLSNYKSSQGGFVSLSIAPPEVRLNAPEVRLNAPEVQQDT